MGAALARRGISVTTLWWEGEASWSARRTFEHVRGWGRGVLETLREGDAEAVLLHYSVFAWSHRGVPCYVPTLVRSVAGGPVPVVTVLHEAAYPFGRRGWRGAVWAITQRAALVTVMRASSAAVATTEDRAAWLTDRSWLPRRPVSWVPVFSNTAVDVPWVGSATRVTGEEFLLGVFGYGQETVSAEAALSAVARLAGLGLETRLLLIGAPGQESRSGRHWSQTAQSLGFGRTLAFTGVVDLSELAGWLSRLDVLLFPDLAGPTSRKSSLAAALACGVPVVALSGPSAWAPLAESEAVLLVSGPDEMADAVLALSRNPDRLRELGARGRSFYEELMSEDVVADRLAECLRGVTSFQPSGAERGLGDEAAS